MISTHSREANSFVREEGKFEGPVNIVWSTTTEKPCDTNERVLQMGETEGQLLLLPSNWDTNLRERERTARENERVRMQLFFE